MVVVARVRAAVDDVLVLAALTAGVVGAALWGVGVCTYAWNEMCVCGQQAVGGMGSCFCTCSDSPVGRVRHVAVCGSSGLNRSG